MNNKIFTTHKIRERLDNMTQKKFAEKFGISVRTVENWDSRGTMPEWAFDLFNKLIDLDNQVFELKGTLNLVKMGAVDIDKLDFLAN